MGPGVVWAGIFILTVWWVLGSGAPGLRCPLGHKLPGPGPRAHLRGGCQAQEPQEWACGRSWAWLPGLAPWTHLRGGHWFCEPRHGESGTAALWSLGLGSRTHLHGWCRVHEPQGRGCGRAQDLERAHVPPVRTGLPRCEGWSAGPHADHGAHSPLFLWRISGPTPRIRNRTYGRLPQANGQMITATIWTTWRL